QVSTLPEIIRRAGRAFSNRVAVVDGDRTATFREVDERSIRLANALRSLTGDGHRVAILMSNRLEYIEADAALARGAMVKVPINPRLSDDERRFIIEDSGATAVITESAELDRLHGALDSTVKLISVDGGSGALDYEELLAAANAVEEPVPGDPERL